MCQLLRPHRRGRRAVRPTAPAIEVAARRRQLETTTYGELVDRAPAAWPAWLARRRRRRRAIGSAILADNDARWIAAYLGVAPDRRRRRAARHGLQGRAGPHRARRAAARACCSRRRDISRRRAPRAAGRRAATRASSPVDAPGVASAADLARTTAHALAPTPPTTRRSCSTRPARPPIPKGVVLTHANLDAERAAALRGHRRHRARRGAGRAAALSRARADGQPAAAARRSARASCFSRPSARRRCSRRSSRATSRSSRACRSSSI